MNRWLAVRVDEGTLPQDIKLLSNGKPNNWNTHRELGTRRAGLVAVPMYIEHRTPRNGMLKDHVSITSLFDGWTPSTMVTTTC